MADYASKNDSFLFNAIVLIQTRQVRTLKFEILESVVETSFCIVLSSEGTKRLGNVYSAPRVQFHPREV